jgi:hypothetical protein
MAHERRDHAADQCDRLFAGKALGGLLGIRYTTYLARYKHASPLAFTGIVIAVGFFVVGKPLIC